LTSPQRDIILVSWLIKLAVRRSHAQLYEEVGMNGRPD